ncbi:MAG: hypothetical protein A2145_00845 [candidate division Zixibacteria bacterium RBG_16_40_9]|nr:MAG: hypothetical protein A2145_00845 [candidate division Zixibacteria bacterium RBG_16_40_9]
MINRIRNKYLKYIFLGVCLTLLAGAQVISKVVKVKEVIDGDTVILETGEHLRYTGIDCPEKDQPFYQEAQKFNQKLVQGKEIRTEFDVQKKDKYGRILAYVYVGDIFVNAELIKNGLANLYTVPPNVKHTDYFLKLQNQAKSKELGIWSEIRAPEPNYLARRGSRRFHRPTCTVIMSAPHKDLLIFKTTDEALKQGYSPCKICRP